MIHLDKITLICIDCLDLNRALKAVNICTQNIVFGKVKLITSQSIPHNTSKEIDIINFISINNIQEYSKFMIKELTNYIDTEYVLCIQWDGFILNPDAWTDEFLQYDYIGAPWWFNDEMNVGNGGFSLRSKKFLEVSSRVPIKNFHPEDLVLCRTYRYLMEKEGIKFAPESLARQFSLEGNAKQGHIWDGEFGFHDIQQTNISKWKGYNQFNE